MSANWSFQPQPIELEDAFEVANGISTFLRNRLEVAPSYELVICRPMSRAPS